jgi:hypothetical protein
MERDYTDGHPSERVDDPKTMSTYRTADGRYVAVYSHALVRQDICSAPMATRTVAKRALWQQLLRAGWRQEVWR